MVDTCVIKLVVYDRIFIIFWRCYNAAPFGARLHSTKLRCTHLTYTTLFRATCWATLWLWATMHLLGARLHPTELRCTQWNYAALSELPPFIEFFKMQYWSSGTTMKRSPVPDKETQSGTEMLYLSYTLCTVYLTRFRTYKIALPPQTKT
jgi:hypothetical protein